MGLGNDEIIEEFKREYLIKEIVSKPMLSKDDVKTYARLHNQVEEKIYEIVKLHSDIDDRYYEIKEIEAQDRCFLIQLEYYKWQDVNHHSLLVSYDLLYDQSSFDNLKNKSRQEKIKRLSELEEKKKLQIEQKLREARELLAMHDEI
ncbi:hypothetical protein [Paenibacillus lautus]|uniref:hypothetical protein n=1 Tax=Paenibacillus lautus TaxID=1401 RepID=UPI001C7CCF70|nr:hypothetical protein [Paenibacillus lautus]MBX4152354.1 hypothetical protein [Paenibacillus lautus]